jgi:predicted Zn finger-like uncharacterized protein
VYTQCSKCETVFKLSAEVLRTAGGQVRCGKCGEVFSALARLAEDSSAFTVGESPLELETRADSILEFVVPEQGIQEFDYDNDSDTEDFARPGVEIARIEILDWPEDDQAQHSDDDRSLEFTLPPGQLDRIFIESKKAAPQPTLQPQQTPEPAPQPPPPTPQFARKPAPQPAAQFAPEFAPQAAPPALPGAPPHPESVLLDVPPTRSHVSGFEVPEEVRREMLAEFEQHLLPELETRSAARRNVQRPPLILWLCAAIASALLLLAQVVHQNRAWFVAHTHGPFGAAVGALYGAVGSPLPAPSNLSAYQLRQWGVTGDPDANGTLRLRASILNAAAQLQPYPLLRVTLADRFGKSIGRRDFEPSEYMGKPTARLLAPGERADAMLEILDPGKNAEGFEVDVCMRGVDRRISCANDVAPQTKQ